MSSYTPIQQRMRRDLSLLRVSPDPRSPRRRGPGTGGSVMALRGWRIRGLSIWDGAVVTAVVAASSIASLTAQSITAKPLAGRSLALPHRRGADPARSLRRGLGAVRRRSAASARSLRPPVRWSRSERVPADSLSHARYRDGAAASSQQPSGFRRSGEIALPWLSLSCSTSSRIPGLDVEVEARRQGSGAMEIPLAATKHRERFRREPRCAAADYARRVSDPGNTRPALNDLSVALRPARHFKQASSEPHIVAGNRSGTSPYARTLPFRSAAVCEISV